jgi:Undecaprenyl-phosphate glucose phosphotransferase
MDMQSAAFQSEALTTPMIKQRVSNFQPQHLAYLSLIFDMGLFVLAGVAAAVWAGPAGGSLYRLSQILTASLLLIAFLACCRIARLHEPLNLVRTGSFRHLLKASLCFGIPPLVALAICLPYLRNTETEVHHFLTWMSWFAVFAVVFAVLSRITFFAALPLISVRIMRPQRIAVVGAGESARRLIGWLEATNPDLFTIVGVFDDRDRERTARSGVAGLIRGNTADLIDLYKSSAFDKIVIALPHSAEERLLHLLRRLRQLPVDIVLGPDLVGFQLPEGGRTDIAGLQVFSLADRPIREPQRILKGTLDQIAAALLLLLLSPLLLTAALAIKLDSSGPILFRQPRQGLGDRLFDVFKFRTMHVALGDPAGENQTRRDDPRITRVGLWLRRTSIDELPQLLNVLIGDMSLVGPRPHTPHMLIGDKRHFEIVDEYSFRHRVKPGITGLAQVNGYRGAVDTPEHLRARIHYDLYYIDHWSLWLDFKILCRTAFICFSGVNAY